MTTCNVLILNAQPCEVSAPSLILHQAPGGWGLPSLSPFCLKLETYLRIVGIPYQCVSGENPAKGPKRKIPWIEHEGRKLGDSGIIIDYLSARYGCDANEDLSEAERALALATQRLIEESLAWALAYDRWVINGKERSRFRDIVLREIPKPMRKIITPLARSAVKRQLLAQGMGRHSTDEVHDFGRRDIAAIANLLGAKRFLMGDKPTTVDASAFGVLANILKPPLESPMKDEALRHANLVDFVERIRSTYFV